MGHTQSSQKHSSLGEWRDFILSQGHLLRQVATLKYTELVQVVEGLNTICNTLCNSKGKYLVFGIIPGADCTTILWKSRVKIQCQKMTSEDHRCESTRTMTLKQFLQVYESIMQQCESIGDRLTITEESQIGGALGCNESTHCGEGAARCTCSLEGVSKEAAWDGEKVPSRPTELDHPNPGLPGGWLEVSTIFQEVEQVSLESIEEGDCCICMDNKSDIALRCGHTYCQRCIEAWRKQHNTCPMCMGDIGATKDVWAFPEKPNTDEMTAYLMGIADDVKEQRQTESSGTNGTLEEWEKLSFNG